MYCTLDGKEVSNLSSFYARNVLDENGQLVFRDDELVQNYVLEDGSMEYHILLDSEGKKGFSKVKMFWKTTTEDEDGEDAQYTLNDFYEVPFN